MINNKTVDLTVLLVLFAFGLVFVSVNTQSVLAQSSTAAKCPKCAGSSATGTNATKGGAIGSAQQLSQLGVGAAGSQMIKNNTNIGNPGQKCPKC